jgi:hypothetical protein
VKRDSTKLTQRMQRQIKPNKIVGRLNLNRNTRAAYQTLAPMGVTPTGFYTETVLELLDRADLDALVQEGLIEVRNGKVFLLPVEAFTKDEHFLAALEIRWP